MKLVQKKEVKHSVVYETADGEAPARAVYVRKAWFWKQGFIGGGFPQAIELEIKVIK